MELDIDEIINKSFQNDLTKDFIQKLSEFLEDFKFQNNIKEKKLEEIQLTSDEDWKFYKRQWSFLENYFKKELSDLSNGEIFLVTNKYENDYKYHRYKVTQYIDGLECKHIAFAKDLPENVKLGDVVRKVGEKYIYDKQATQYVRNSLAKIKQDIINERNLENLKD